MGISVARAAAYPSLPNGNFLPDVWSLLLQKKFYNQCFLPQITNSDYEGEIKSQGSKVIIRKIPTVNIGDYQVNGTINYQTLADDKLELLIDHAKYRHGTLIA